MSAALKVQRTGAVARVTLNRPQARNALDEGLLSELTAAFRALGKDKSLRAAVLSGAGQDFCAGADIGWMRRAADYGKTESRQDARRLIDMCRALDEAPCAVIARVQGNCFGGGLGLIAACDAVVAEEAACFRFSEARLGLIPAVVSTFVLPKIGAGRARYLYLTADLFRAPAAKEIGLVHLTAPADALDSEVERLVKGVLRNGPQAVCGAKAYLRKLDKFSRSKRLAYSEQVLARVRSTPEAKEGLSAFLEKRSPKWVEEV